MKIMVKKQMRATNAVIIEHIEGLTKLNKLRFNTLDEKLIGINAHLKTMNGQVEKNKKFRIGTLAVLKVLGIVVTGAGGVLIFLKSIGVL